MDDSANTFRSMGRTALAGAPRAVVGGILVFAAYQKAANSPLLAYGFLALEGMPARVAIALICLVEATVGAALVFGIAHRVAHTVGLLLFMSFILFHLELLPFLESQQDSCGCLGLYFAADADHALFISVSVIALLLLVWSLTISRPSAQVIDPCKGTDRPVAGALPYLGVLSCSVLAAALLAQSHFSTDCVSPGVCVRDAQVILNPGDWVGHPWPLGRLVDGTGTFRVPGFNTGSHAILFRDGGCNQCCALERLIVSGASTDYLRRRLIVLDVGHRPEASSVLSPHVAVLSPRASVSFVVPTPLLVEIRDGDVVSVHEGFDACLRRVATTSAHRGLVPIERAARTSLKVGLDLIEESTS